MPKLTTEQVNDLLKWSKIKNDLYDKCRCMIVGNIFHIEEVVGFECCCCDVVVIYCEGRHITTKEMYPVCFEASLELLTRLDKIPVEQLELKRESFTIYRLVEKCVGDRVLTSI